jgi:signal transduction histidine kinase
VAKHLDRIGAEVKRASQTISDLLDLARNRPLRPVRTPLAPLVESAVEAALLPEAVAFEARIPEGLAAEVDPDQMRQVLVNLLANAAQAMRGRGRVELEARPTAAGGVHLRVRDDGPGVPTEVRPRIFEALFTTKAKGSGLGLALCRRIMEAHGATIVLEPADPAHPGASFLIELPPTPTVAAEASPAPAT